MLAHQLFSMLDDLFSDLLLQKGVSTTDSQKQHEMSMCLLAENSHMEQVASSESAKPWSPRRRSAAKLYNAEFELDRTLFKKV